MKTLTRLIWFVVVAALFQPESAEAQTCAGGASLGRRSLQLNGNAGWTSRPVAARALAGGGFLSFARLMITVDTSRADFEEEDFDSVGARAAVSYELSVPDRGRLSVCPELSYGRSLSHLVFRSLQGEELFRQPVVSSSRVFRVSAGARAASWGSMEIMPTAMVAWSHTKVVSSPFLDWPAPAVNAGSIAAGVSCCTRTVSPPRFRFPLRLGIRRGSTRRRWPS